MTCIALDKNKQASQSVCLTHYLYFLTGWATLLTCRACYPGKWDPTSHTDSLFKVVLSYWWPTSLVVDLISGYGRRDLPLESWGSILSVDFTCVNNGCWTAGIGSMSMPWWGRFSMKQITMRWSPDDNQSLEIQWRTCGTCSLWRASRQAWKIVKPPASYFNRWYPHGIHWYSMAKVETCWNLQDSTDLCFGEPRDWPKSSRASELGQPVLHAIHHPKRIIPTWLENGDWLNQIWEIHWNCCWTI